MGKRSHKLALSVNMIYLSFKSEEVLYIKICVVSLGGDRLPVAMKGPEGLLCF